MRFEILLLLFAPTTSSPTLHETLASARAAFEASPSSPSAALSLANALTDIRNFTAAAAVREGLLRGGGPSTPSSWAALAHDLRHARRYPEALHAVHEAQRAAGDGDALLLATLLEFEAELLACVGHRRSLEALRVFARAVKARRGAPPGAQGGGGGGAPSALLELSLLDRVLHVSSGVPAEVARGLAARRASVVARMVGGGPWRSEAQLPAHFNPRLRSAPWWDDDGGRAEARAALVAAAPALRAEFAVLRDGHRLEPETECIAEPRAGAGGGGDGDGGWRVFTAQGPWHEARDANRCAAALAPTACALTARLLELGLPVQRVGYSALAPGAVLRPHYGPTNAALKFHLGLFVPVDGAGVGCAAITVGGETRRWARDGVLSFDDSFLHNVSYAEGCGRGEERVVFQVVFLHPQLPEEPDHREL
jgi:hypothetical protein